jgi:hypothetical protein
MTRKLTTAPLVSQQEPSGNSEETDELHGRSGGCAGRVDSLCICGVDERWVRIEREQDLWLEEGGRLGFEV